MSTTSHTSDSIYSKESFSTDFTEVNNWIASSKDEKASSTLNSNSKLNAEIHLAIIKEPSEYASSLCDYLFTLYRDVQHRPFVLQFLPSFVIAYYDVFYHHHHPESVGTTTKDVCSTIDTFLVGLYNLSVLDDTHNETTYEFRIPNLTLPSIYHTPNPDHYAPTPLTQHAISKHEKKYEVVRLQTFAPFDSVNATTREQILWFLLIQYGAHVSVVDAYSRQFYLKMSRKLLSQGFPFDENSSSKSNDSILPPTGRRIYVSSRIMSEILGTLSYFKANSTDREASECMRLLKRRAEYEMYADVILMTESMSYLHEFETQRSEQQDPIGIEIELPPTVDMVKQKRTAITTRSMKDRHRSHRHPPQPSETATIENDLPNDTIEHLTFVPAPSDASPTALVPPMSQLHKSILDVLDENSPTTEFIRSASNMTSLSTEQQNERKPSIDGATTPVFDETKSNISSSIGPAVSSPSPSSARHYKPISLSSTQIYFNQIQQRQRSSSPNIQNVQTVIHQNDDDDDDVVRPRTSSIKHGPRKETVASVRFVGKDENGKKPEETYL